MDSHTNNNLQTGLPDDKNITEMACLSCLEIFKLYDVKAIHTQHTAILRAWVIGKEIDNRQKDKVIRKL